MLRSTWPSLLAVCFAHAFSLIFASQAQSSQAPPPYIIAAQADDSTALPSDPANSWRITRSPGVDGGADSSAILHISDIKRSDPRLAGLMLRCSKKGVDAIIVVIEPFPPQTHPKITLHVGGQEFYFVSSVVATGVGLILPADGMQLAKGPWRNADELSVKISEGDAEISGVIKLSGLEAAIQSLAECAAK